MTYPFKTVWDARKANRALAKKTGRAYWFDVGEMAFWNTRVHGRNLIAGKYFVTSERMDRSRPWRYSIRRARPDGSIETVGEFQAYKTLETAKNAAKKLKDGRT